MTNNNIKNICLIPARGGSKRIPKKNIKMFHGKPLIAWSIEAAKSCGLFSNIYVSSDDDEIIDVAKFYGAKIPFIRPKNLSNDFAKDIEVINHFLSYINENNIKANYLCYLYPTAPLIEKKTLEGCLKLLKDKNVKEVFTITSFAYPPQKSLKNSTSNGLELNWAEFKGKRSQDLEPLYHDAGQCYFFNLNSKIQNIRLGYELPRYKCQDIDTIEDFENLEKLYEFLKYK